MAGMSKKRILEEPRGGLDQLVKDLHDTALINRPVVVETSPMRWILPPTHAESRSTAFTNNCSIIENNRNQSFTMETGLEEKKRRTVCFSDAMEYQNCEIELDPPIKRRRFQRRNSKTAAMLVQEMSAELKDLRDRNTYERLNAESNGTYKKLEKVKDFHKVDVKSWDPRIVEPYVKHLHNHELSKNLSCKGFLLPRR